jgi:hypothetical protein
VISSGAGRAILTDVALVHTLVLMSLVYAIGSIVGGVAAALLYRVVMELDARPLPAQSPIRGESAASPVETG